VKIPASPVSIGAENGLWLSISNNCTIGLSPTNLTESPTTSASSKTPKLVVPSRQMPIAIRRHPIRSTLPPGAAGAAGAASTMAFGLSTADSLATTAAWVWDSPLAEGTLPVKSR
jgi:hypothetical protein